MRRRTQARDGSTRGGGGLPQDRPAHRRVGHLHRVARRAGRAHDRRTTDRRQPAAVRNGRGARAFCWLLFLAPFFYLTYGAANWIAASRAPACHRSSSAGSTHIPFLGLDDRPLLVDQRFLRPVALRLRDAGRARHARRAASSRRRSCAVACFILFPLRFTFTQPETDGLPASCSMRWRASTSRSTRRRRCTSRCWSSCGCSMPGICRAGRYGRCTLVRAGRRFGAHHVSASLHRHPDRRAARVVLSVALAGSRTEPDLRRSR